MTSSQTESEEDKGADSDEEEVTEIRPTRGSRRSGLRNRKVIERLDK